MSRDYDATGLSRWDCGLAIYRRCTVAIDALEDESGEDESYPEAPVPIASPLLMARFEEHLEDLPHCSRCESDRDEKCDDRHLAFAEAPEINDVMCGCGCWTRPAAEDGRMPLPLRHMDPIPRNGPANRTDWLHELSEVVRMDAMAERKSLRTRGVLSIEGVSHTDFLDPVLQEVKPIPDEQRAGVRAFMDRSEETVESTMQGYRDWLLSWIVGALESEALDDQLKLPKEPRSEAD